MRRSLRAPALAIALVVLAASGTGCGGSDDGSSDAGKPTTTVKLSGPPVKIVSIQGDLTKDLNLPGLRAGVAAVNAAGGVHGRRIELEVCFDKNDANTAARCARDAVADSSVIATVSNQNNFGTTVNPVLESAGMASVGSEPYTQSDFTSKVIFPTAVGGLSVAGAAAVAADVVDAKRIVLPVIDVTAGRTLPPLIDAGVLAPRGMKLAATVPVPLTAADVSAQAAAVTDAKPDAILFALTPDIGQRFIQALLQQGSKRPFVFPAGGDAGQLEEQFHISENVYAAGMYNAESAGYRQFVSDLEAHEPKADPSDQSAMAWLAVKLFAKVANDAPEVSRSAVLSGLNGLKSFDTDGMTPVLDFTKPNPALGGALPRLFNTTVVPAKLEDHKFVQVESGFVDIFVAPKG